MIGTGRFLIVYMMLAAAGIYLTHHADLTVPLNTPLSQFPTTVGEWRMTSQTAFSPEVLAVLKPSDYLYATYARSNEASVQLYVGYHGGGERGGEIHSPKNCLPGGGWFEVATKKSVLKSGVHQVSLVQSVYQKGEVRELFLYWFQVGDRSLTSEYALKLAQIGNSVRHRRRDATFVRIVVPVRGSVAEATTIGERFVTDFYPVIARHLPQ
jgi:EpsI family protein